LEIIMTEYLSLTLLGEPNETENAFKSRLYAFWTHMLRHHAEIYEKVYAEATEFTRENVRVARQYMVEQGGLSSLLNELASAQIEHMAVDYDDLYSQAEVSGSEWFQLEH
jgi:hypothetical protein